MLQICGRIENAMRFSVLTLTLALMAAANTAHATDCDRACLRGFITQYLDALVTHNPGTLPLGDKVAVRNHWTATDSETGKKLEFRGIVIWRIVNKKIVERWAYLEAPHPA